MKLETGKMVVMWGFPNQLVPIIGMITCIETRTQDKIKVITIYDGIRHYDVRTLIKYESYVYNNDLVSLWTLGGFLIRIIILFMIISLLILEIIT